MSPTNLNKLQNTWALTCNNVWRAIGGKLSQWAPAKKHHSFYFTFIYNETAKTQKGIQRNIVLAFIDRVVTTTGNFQIFLLNQFVQFDL